VDRWDNLADLLGRHAEPLVPDDDVRDPNPVPGDARLRSAGPLDDLDALTAGVGVGHLAASSTITTLPVATQ
jgi:hypothetical protein